MAARLSHPALLTDPAALSRLLGPVESVRTAPLDVGPSLTGHRLERVEVHLVGGGRRDLVLKRVRPAASWIARRTDDAHGREARLLEEPALAPVWEVFASPYLAHARGGGEVGLLMEDLGQWLLPSGVEPIAPEPADRLLGALARLHARFWGRVAPPDLPWAVRPARRFGLFHPTRLDDPSPVFALARRGWPAALARLPPRLAALLTRPPAELAALGGDLPTTLLHGDCKLANFATRPRDRAVFAFDWEGLAVGPAALELGYYLAINGARLPLTRERILARYRAHLDDALGSAVDGSLWDRTEALAVLAGANLLLWQKALPLLEATPPGSAVAEWDWWVDALARRW